MFGSSPLPSGRPRGDSSLADMDTLQSLPYDSTIAAGSPTLGRFPIKGSPGAAPLPLEQAVKGITRSRQGDGQWQRRPTDDDSLTSSSPSKFSRPALTEDTSSYPHSTSSPETRSIDFHDSIREVDEDETSSEAVEPLTPTSDTHTHDLPHGNNAGTVEATGGTMETPPELPISKPLIVQIPATPPRNKQTPTTPPSAVEPTSSVDSPSQSSSTSKRLASRRLAAFFHRTHSNSHSANAPQNDTRVRHGATFAIGSMQEHRPSQSRRPSSFSLSAGNSPWASKSHSPPSPGSPNLTLDDGHLAHVASEGSTSPKHSVSATTLNANDRFGRIRFVPGQKPERTRSTSGTRIQPVKKLENNSISRPAETGVGLKARRMSTSLPDDFTVDTVELNKEFTSTSLVPGRRGKMVGSGATAQVKLMARKGGPADYILAVKEFRKKGKQESVQDYEKKVISEFTIAKSLHHPNIVETVRLCTHSGRYNHVMEYCPQGELFSLVQRDYFKESDRQCLFKQLLRGVSYLHCHGIAHRDIKLENLLLTNEGQLKITDFGVSEVFCGEHPGVRAGGGQCGKNMKEPRRSAPGICGSMPYIAPEVLEKKGDYDPRPLDVWSCAIVYFMMRFKGSPWASAERSQAGYAEFLKGWEKFESKHPDQLITDEAGLPKCGRVFGEGLESQGMRRLLLRMLHPTPEKRIGIHEALTDRWVKTIECCGKEPEGGPQAGIDAAGTQISKKCAKSCIRKVHNHLPPAKRVLLNSFEIKEG
ncbi:MAG: hypothetical protein M1833_001659 [Piccolia ochrophora]|nr:MAG: hypothetical protein M1833_001659 [Piccolia ochrophora]